jgi:hypothetical protein
MNINMIGVPINYLKIKDHTTARPHDNKKDCTTARPHDRTTNSRFLFCLKKQSNTNNKFVYCNRFKNSIF